MNKTLNFSLILLSLISMFGLSHSVKNPNDKGGVARDNERKKVFVIQIIENNWDNIEMSFGKKLVSHMTKKEYIKHNYSNIVISRDNLNRFRKEIEFGTKYFILHQILYLKNFDVLSDTDVVNWNIGRNGNLSFSYQFTDIPNKIPLKKPVLGTKYKGYEDQVWVDFKGARFVEDIDIISIDNNGNIELRYLNNNYICKIEDTIELPTIKKILPSTEFIWDNPNGLDKNTINKVVKKHGKFPSGNKDGIKRNILLGEDIYPNQEIKYFYIKTKITLINYGYIEFKE